MSSPQGSIVVGYDGSPASRAAVEWATAEAVRLHVPLRLVQVLDPIVTSRSAPGQVVPSAAHRAARQQALDALATGIGLHQPHLSVDTRVLEGRPAEQLLQETDQAKLLVLGSRGLGGWTGLMVGSVAVQVSTHAACPVVVVPSDLHSRINDPASVIVGVDGSKISAKAIDFAFDQAEALHADLVAVHAWTSPYLTYADGESMIAFDEEAEKESCRLLVAESVAGAAADHPEVRWQTRLISGQAGRAILVAAQSANLVVVGSRGRGGFAGLLLGSVSQSVLHHAHCPVAIVR
ncbi:nucleotide-binding universal stress UspA family protein [Kribbella amoyensis]|uniref:Nucleotide-binding universal stress UspA family protein n=1 Tax=Kribbella amoyensis TaxID=996641 RepID=A0A561C0Z7_9ACTN|nr:universal stress protein [Kribbella amoyensis]TWD84592.1 nucleotide-binding universal stress UspA family protein [Kribbella amoyensis]